MRVFYWCQRARLINRLYPYTERVFVVLITRPMQHEDVQKVKMRYAFLLSRIFARTSLFLKIEHSFFRKKELYSTSTCSDNIDSEKRGGTEQSSIIISIINDSHLRIFALPVQYIRLANLPELQFCFQYFRFLKDCLLPPGLEMSNVYVNAP